MKFRVERRSNNPITWQAIQDQLTSFGYGGTSYGLTGTTASLSQKQEDIGRDYASLVGAAYKSNGVVFACMLARMLLFSEARFQFRQMSNGRPGDLYGTKALAPLETPWTNATTGNLLARMEQDASLAGNFFGVRPDRMKARGRVFPGQDQIRRVRPDWITIIAGSKTSPDGDDPGWAIDAEVVAYLYHPGGPQANREPIMLLPEQVAHYAPIPDPVMNFRGMSWLSPVVTEIMGDKAATLHKLMFFENGATPNIVVTQPDTVNEEKWKQWVRVMRESHGTGILDAYKTLYLGGGADAKVIGADMKQIDFKVTQGAGETRIAAAAGVPPIIVGLSEGLQAATYSNYGQARRAFADGTMRPLWRNASGALASIIDVPSGSDLWYDDRDIPFLQEDQQDNATIQTTQATTIHTLVTAGFTPDSAVAAVTADDMTLLAHTGMYSVQLLPAGTIGEGKGSVVGGQAVPADSAPASPAADAANAAFLRLATTP